MDPRHLELAAEFCKLVGKPTLVEYLGLPSGAGAEEAQELLKSRRRYMQGMQSNPKYKQEALLLIKNYTIFSTLLNEPEVYRAGAQSKAERKHLPIVEMTIKGALQSGAPSPEQLDFLKRNASELGVSDDTFSGSLERLMVEAGLRPAPPGTKAGPPSFIGGPTVQPAAPPKPAPPPAPVKSAQSTGTPPEEDHYKILHVPRTATRAEIYESYRSLHREAKNLPDRREIGRAHV